MAFPSAIGCFVIGHSPIFTGGPCLPISRPLLKTIQAYLYWQYRDDDNLQAFVDAYNTLTQEFVDWFNALDLPIYTRDPVSGALLDWVAASPLYGLLRPVLGAGTAQEEGPYDTYAYDELAYDEIIKVSSVVYTSVTDDIFRRIITWHFLKGDGKTFDVRWLKRRVMRFLTGTDGTNPNIDQTYPISISFGYQGQVNIILITHQTVVNSGAFYDEFAYDEMSYDELSTASVRIRDQFALAQAFKEAMDEGVLEFPFQFQAVVQVQP